MILYHPSKVLRVLGVLLLSAAGNRMAAQDPAPEPVPVFRYGVPLIQVGSSGVKEAVLIDYSSWQKDSAATANRVLRLGRTGKERVVYQYRTDGKLERALMIYAYGVNLAADWEQIWHYDSLGRPEYMLGRYQSQLADTSLFPDSTAFRYDAGGRLVEKLELQNLRPLETGPTEESGWRTRYQYLRGGRVAAREKCRTRMAGTGTMKCGTDSLDFDAEGRLVQVRWIVEAYRDSLRGYPPEKTFDYDAEGRLVAVHHYLHGAERFLTRYEYDEQGRVLEEISINTRMHNARAQVLRFRYGPDGLPERISLSSPDASGLRFDYKVLYEFY